MYWFTAATVLYYCFPYLLSHTFSVAQECRHRGSDIWHIILQWNKASKLFHFYNLSGNNSMNGCRVIFLRQLAQRKIYIYIFFFTSVHFTIKSCFFFLSLLCELLLMQLFTTHGFPAVVIVCIRPASPLNMPFKYWWDLPGNTQAYCGLRSECNDNASATVVDKILVTDNMSITQAYTVDARAYIRYDIHEP